jgi:scavenger receptor class B protein 1
VANASVICCCVNEEGKEFYDTCNFRWFLNAGLNVINEHLFVKKTAGEILFDGYKDPILDAAEFIHKFNIPIPGIMDRFGFYYGRNGSDWWDGVFNMYTGK